MAMYQIGQDGRYFIKYGVESWLGDGDEDSAYLLQIEGVVLFSPDDEADGVVCGRLRSYVLRTEEMISHGKFDLDTWEDEDELDDIAKTIYSDAGFWSAGIKAVWPDVDKMDVLVIEEIFIDKEHRKAGLGLLIADRTISVFGRGCGLAVISPWPTEVEDRNNDEAHKVAHGKIGSYSQRLGFRNVPGSDLWALSLEHTIERDGSN
jgi:hypothetical protein